MVKCQDHSETTCHISTLIVIFSTRVYGMRGRAYFNETYHVSHDMTTFSRSWVKGQGHRVLAKKVAPRSRRLFCNKKDFTRSKSNRKKTADGDVAIGITRTSQHAVFTCDVVQLA